MKPHIPVFVVALFCMTVRGQETPIATSIVLDTSGSMTSKLPVARQFIAEFVRQSNAADEIAVIQASDRPRASRDRQKVLLVISDGADNNSRYSMSEIASAVRDTGVRVYVIAASEMDGTVLARLAEHGGLVALGSSSDARQAATELLRTIR